MRGFFKIALVFTILVALFSFTVPEKKISKLISKVWKEKVVELNQIQVPDSIKNIEQLNVILHENELIGYACYTSAFGCKVGGCPAPSNPTAEAYETFDYIIIYDHNLTIKMIEIVDYTGQYGYQICRAKWLEQFHGKTNNFKLNENIDGISGATISATYLIDAVNELGVHLKSLKANNII